MSTGIDSELRAALHAASDFVQSPPGLADKVRGAARKRRRRLAATIAGTTAIFFVGAVGSYLAAEHRPQAAAPTSGRTWHAIYLPLGCRQAVHNEVGCYNVQELAVSGRYLYLLAMSDGGLSSLRAYDRTTGHLLGAVPLPDNSTAITVGPAGFVWLTGSTTTWLLSPDLRLRSSYALLAGPLVPISRTTAFVVTQYGLVTLHMPTPGHSGAAYQQPDRGATVGPSSAPGAWAGLLDGHVVAQVTDGYGYDIHLVMAGRPRTRFGGSLKAEIGAVTSTGSSLWAQTLVITNGYAASWGPLIRLDNQLHLTTPSSVRDSAVLARTEVVWSYGNTIWVITGAPGHSLVCFTAGRSIGPLTTLRVAGVPNVLAATRDTVYVSIQPGPWKRGPVIAYSVPAACR